MDKFEKLVNDIMKEAETDGEPVTREEAEEMAQMELGAKNLRYEIAESSEKKERKPKERKVDEEKKHLLSCIRVLLQGMGANDFAIKTETELEFIYNGNPYNIKLIKHRPKKWRAVAKKCA